MNPSVWLAAIAVLLCFSAVWELAGSHGEAIGSALERIVRRVQRGGSTHATTPLYMGLARRLDRAGLAHRLQLPVVLAAKGAGVLAAVGVAFLAAPAAPGRTAVLVALALPAAGFVAPDALLEHAARRRHARLVAALPDALDLMAAGTAAGRSHGTALAAVAGGSDGPLAVELRICVAEIACGVPAAEALAVLRDRVGGAELAALVAAMGRSRRYGSPLADQLREQASALRREQSRLVEERAARAAPKIQLVVALVLVPSVLLMIIAALLGNTGAITGG